MVLMLTLGACSADLVPEVATATIEAHIRAVAPDVAPADIALDVNNVLQLDDYSWEARFGEGETAGAMVLRRSSEGWTVARYEGDATLDFMAGLAAEQWLMSFDPMATLIADVASTVIVWEATSMDAQSAAIGRQDSREMDRLIEARRFGPSQEQFATLISEQVTVPDGLTLNYEPGSLSVAAVVWAMDPVSATRGCGMRLSSDPLDVVTEPSLIWIDDTSIVCTNDGFVSDSYSSTFERARAQLTTDGVLRP